MKEGAYIALGFVGGVDTVLDIYELGRSLMNHDWTGAAFAAVFIVIPGVGAHTGKTLVKGLESRAVRELGEEVLEEARDVALNPKIYAQLEKQLAEHGSGSIRKALNSARKTLTRHEAKLPNLKYKSQVEGTIRNVKSQTKTLEQFIKDKGL